MHSYLLLTFCNWVLFVYLLNNFQPKIAVMVHKDEFGGLKMGLNNSTIFLSLSLSIHLNSDLTEKLFALNSSIKWTNEVRNLDYKKIDISHKLNHSNVILSKFWPY